MQGASKKRLLFFGIPLLVVIVAVIVILALRGQGPAVQLFKKGPKVEVKTTYKNPFDKSTQYVNPFEKYKNPFVTNR